MARLTTSPPRYVRSQTNSGFQIAYFCTKQLIFAVHKCVHIMLHAKIHRTANKSYITNFSTFKNGSRDNNIVVTCICIKHLLII